MDIPTTIPQIVQNYPSSLMRSLPNWAFVRLLVGWYYGEVPLYIMFFQKPGAAPIGEPDNVL